MQTTVTVTLDDNIYEGLNRIIGQNDINKVIESLIHRYVADHDLEEAYRMMAQSDTYSLMFSALYPFFASSFYFK